MHGSSGRNDCLPDALPGSHRQPARCPGKDRQHRQPVGLTRVLVAPTRSACGLGESIVISMQAVSSWPETMRMGSWCFNSLDQAAFAVEIDLSGHAVGRSSDHAHTQGHRSLMRMHRDCQSLLAADPSALRAGCWSWSLNSTGRPAVRNSPRSTRGIVNPAERAGSTHLC